MPEFYMKITHKYFPDLGGGARAPFPSPVSYYTPMYS